jgi:cell division protein ZapE
VPASRFRDAYEDRLQDGWEEDTAQQSTVSAMGSVLASLASGGNRRIRGLYLHGPVGRGKTQLLNLFMDHVGTVTARRIHMHAFMMELHERLFEIKAGDPVIQIARSLANECRVLGFDEF